MHVYGWCVISPICLQVIFFGYHFRRGFAQLSYIRILHIGCCTSDCGVLGIGFPKHHKCLLFDGTNRSCVGVPSGYVMSLRWCENSWQTVNQTSQHRVFTCQWTDDNFIGAVVQDTVLELRCQSFGRLLPLLYLSCGKERISRLAHSGTLFIRFAFFRATHTPGSFGILF